MSAFVMSDTTTRSKHKKLKLGLVAFVGCGLIALSTQFRSYRAFKDDMQLFLVV